MNQISLNLERYLMPQTKAKSERAILLEQFVEEINKERASQNWKYKVGEKWKRLSPATGRMVAIKTSHLSQQDLYYFYSSCKSARCGFSKAFFGSLSTGK